MIGKVNTFPVQMTVAQMEIINDLIECNIFDVIRNDVEIDSMEWLKNICAVHETFKNRIKEIMDENYHKEEMEGQNETKEEKAKSEQESL